MENILCPVYFRKQVHFLLHYPRNFATFLSGHLHLVYFRQQGHFQLRHSRNFDDISKGSSSQYPAESPRLTKYQMKNYIRELTVTVGERRETQKIPGPIPTLANNTDPSKIMKENSTHKLVGNAVGQVNDQMKMKQNYFRVKNRNINSITERPNR